MKPMPKRRTLAQEADGQFEVVPGVYAQGEVKPWPKTTTPRVIALDLSSTCTGWAIGPMGENPEDTGSIKCPKGDLTDAERFLYFWEQIKEKFKRYDCQFILAEELNHFTNARTARLLAGLAGAISVLAKVDLRSEVLFLNTSKCRAAIHVDLTWATAPGGKKYRPDVKARVKERLAVLGVHDLPEDEADAAVILLGAGVLIETTKEGKSCQ